LIDPLDATIVLDWKEGEEDIDLYELFKKEMDIKTNIDKDCTIDSILTYVNKEDYPASPKDNFALSDFLSKYTQTNKGTATYNFAVSANGRKDMSKLATATLVICGAEKVSPTDGDAEIGVKKGEEFFEVSEDVFSKYFTIDISSPGANELCGINKYELVDQNGERTELPDFITKGPEASDAIKIAVAKTLPEGTSVYLRAITRGGERSELKKITVSFECDY
jgi:hypothetical protein